MSREALVLLVCCCDFRDGAEWLIPSKSLRNAVIRAFPGLFCILRMCAPRRAAAVVRPRGREKSADRRRRILISRLLIIRASVPRRKSPFPAYFKGFPAVSLLIPPYPAFLKYPVSPHNLVTDTDFPVCYGEKGRIQAEISRAFEGNLVSFHGGEAVNIIPAKAEALLRDVSMETATRQLGGREDIQIRQEGPLIRVSARGLARHAAFPDGAVNAIHVLAEALAQSGLIQGSGQDAMAALAAMTADFYGNGCGIVFEDRESGKLTSAGSTAHGENGLLTVQFDIRYPVTVRGDLVTDGFTRRVESLGFSVTGTEVSPPAYVSLDDPRISRLCEICDYVQGKHYEPYTMGGGTYSRKLPHAVGFGPGVPDAGNLFGNGHGGCHQPDECVPFSMLKNALKTYILALLELDGML